MAKEIGDVIAGSVDRLVRWVVVPVTSAIPLLVSSGVLLVAFAALWLTFMMAVAMNPGALGESWRMVAGLPLLVQGLAWLLLMPLMAGLWVWQTDWPLVARVAVIVGAAGWNLLVFFPHRGQGRDVGLES